MTKLEKFGLVSGGLGLFVDTIGLASIITGIWNVDGQNTGQVRGTELVFLFISFALIIYGWLAIAWTIARRSWVAHREKDATIFVNIMFSSVLGIGLLIAPLLGMWMWITATPDATSNNLGTQNTIVVPSTPVPSASSSTPVTASKSNLDDANQMLSLILGVPMVGGIIGVGILVVMYTLMPLIYTDMIDVPSTEKS